MSREMVEKIMCDNCNKEHDELKRPVRPKYIFEVYRFDLCEKCYKKISRIEEKMNKELSAIKSLHKADLKKEAEGIYKMMFPREYENSEVENEK